MQAITPPGNFGPLFSEPFDSADFGIAPDREEIKPPSIGGSSVQVVAGEKAWTLGTVYEYSDNITRSSVAGGVSGLRVSASTKPPMATIHRPGSR